MQKLFRVRNAARTRSLNRHGVADKVRNVGFAGCAQCEFEGNVNRGAHALDPSGRGDVAGRTGGVDCDLAAELAGVRSDIDVAI